MWPLPKIRDEFVAVSITPEAVGCYWIQEQPTAYFLQRQKFNKLQAQKLCTMRASSYTACTHSGSENNLTQTAQHISEFLHEHKLKDAFIAFTVAGPGVMQETSSLPIALPTAEQFDQADTHDKQWQFEYLYPSHDGRFLFFLSGIQQVQLLRYKLLAVKEKLNLVGITPTGAAHLYLYRLLNKNSFSSSNLALDLTNAGNTEQLISPEQLSTICSCLPENIPSSTLSAAVGIFLQELHDEK